MIQLKEVPVARTGIANSAGHTQVLSYKFNKNMVGKVLPVVGTYYVDNPVTIGTVTNIKTKTKLWKTLKNFMSLRFFVVRDIVCDMSIDSNLIGFLSITPLILVTDKEKTTVGKNKIVIDEIVGLYRPAILRRKKLGTFGRFNDYGERFIVSRKHRKRVSNTRNFNVLDSRGEIIGDVTNVEFELDIPKTIDNLKKLRFCMVYNYYGDVQSDNNISRFVGEQLDIKFSEIKREPEHTHHVIHILNFILGDSDA